MHALGFFHEHSRFDRDNHIILNAQNIDQSRFLIQLSLIMSFIAAHLKQFNKRNKHPSDLTGPYDLNSILHYEENAFALDPSIPTIISRNTTLNEVLKMGQREELSRADIQKINRYYGCSHVQAQIVEVKKAVETGMTRSIDGKIELHSLKKTKSSYWFKSAADFQIRTGVYLKIV
jgi:hypothetical protein